MKKSDEQVAFLTSLGCAIRRPSLSRTHFNERFKSIMGFRGPVMLDSGGFVLSKKPNCNWTVGAVGKLIRQVEADIYVALDIPPHLDDAREVRRLKIRRSAENFKRLADRFPTKVIMPVLHGRTLGEIEMSINSIRNRLCGLQWLVRYAGAER